ncbi:MAG: DUF1232 domain-containing protein [Snowella sp.]|nr:DUF1232 domain-containing protein [Snowella sp.]
MSVTANQSYSDSGFWDKVKNFALSAGREVVEKALWLYYAAQEKSTPIWAKTIVFSTLAYFISPIDSIPDVVPLVGYTDDLGAIAAAIGMIAMYITDDVKAKAKQTVKKIFGE